MKISVLVWMGCAAGMLLPLWQQGWAVSCDTSPATLSAAKDCGSDVTPLATGTVCRAPWQQLRPTQMAVGEVAVACKTNKIVRKLDDLNQTLQDGIVPVVVGPGIQPDGSTKGAGIYLTDHHHFASAVMDAENQNQGKSGLDWRLYICVENNYLTQNPGMSGDAFVQALKSANPPLLWMYDTNGHLLTNPKQQIFEQTASVSQLEDDPYRTLSAWTRSSLAWVKCEENPGDNDGDIATYCVGHPSNPSYFMEFYWADYFRVTVPDKNGQLVSDVDKQAHAMWDNFYAPAVKAAQKSIANGISGYNSGNVTVKKISINFKGDKMYCVND